jgi:hypothetical protein
MEAHPLLCEDPQRACKHAPTTRLRWPQETFLVPSSPQTYLQTGSIWHIKREKTGYGTINVIVPVKFRFDKFVPGKGQHLPVQVIDGGGEKQKAAITHLKFVMGAPTELALLMFIMLELIIILFLSPFG